MYLNLRYSPTNPQISLYSMSQKSKPLNQKIEPIPLPTNRNGKGKDSSPVPPITNTTRALFDSIIDQPENSIASSSKSTDISLPPKIVDVEVVNDKSKSSEIIEESEIRGTSLVNNEPEISPDLPANDEEAKLQISNSPKPSNEEAST